MGARTSDRKRGDGCLSFSHACPSQYSSASHILKKPRLSSMRQAPERPIVPSNSAVARLSRYPEATPRLGREVHAPCRILNYGFSSKCLNRDSGRRTSGVSVKEEALNEMGNILSYKYDKAKDSALRKIRYLKKDKEKEVIELDKEVIELDTDVDTDNEKGGAVSEDSSIEEIEVVEDGREGRSVVSEHREVINGVAASIPELDARVRDRGLLPSSSSVISDSMNGSLRVDHAEKMLDSLQLYSEQDLWSISAYKKLLEAVERRTPKLRKLTFDIEFNEKRRSMLQLLRPAKKPGEVNFVSLRFSRRDILCHIGAFCLGF